MSDIAIKVEKISKSYMIGHQSDGENYFMLRDIITDKAREWLSRIRNPQYYTHQNIEEFWALKNINFEVKKGERIGIIGANGAGKSTLLKVLSRITEPTTGKAAINGRVGSLLEVGTGFHPELTGRENIFLNGAVLGMTRADIKRKFDEIVDFAGVENFLDTPVKRFSSGMYVRLAFAVAAHLDPEILLIDEVLAVGDAQFQKKSMGKMKDISGDGRTIFFVSHNMQSIIKLCKRVIMLKNGKIEKIGNPDEIVSHYLSDSKSVKGEVVWKKKNQAPGNDKVRMLSVRITQENNANPIYIVDRCKDIMIEIEYLNLNENSSLYTAIQLKDNKGTKVLTASNHKWNNKNNDKWFDTLQPKGRYKSICSIPANLLIEGEFFVTPIIGIQPKYTQVLLEDIISFQTQDTGDENRNALGGWWGVVSPFMDWRTEQMEEIK